MSDDDDDEDGDELSRRTSSRPPSARSDADNAEGPFARGEVNRRPS